MCCTGLRETLEAEVRSKFQTTRCIKDSTAADMASGAVDISASIGGDKEVDNLDNNSRSPNHVEVPFDETVVRYLWLAERTFEVTEIQLRSENANVQIQKALQREILLSEGAGDDEKTVDEEQ